MFEQVCALNNNSKIQVYQFLENSVKLFTEFPIGIFLSFFFGNKIDRYGALSSFSVFGSGSNTYILFTCLESDLFIRVFVLELEDAIQQVYSISGSLLSKYNTCQLQNYHGNFSAYEHHNYFALGTFSNTIPV